MVSRDLPQDLTTYRLPRAPEPQITADGFGACPAVLLQAMRLPQVMSIYQLAFEQARIEARPSLLERDLLGVWN
jgi:hypothetical protein